MEYEILSMLSYGEYLVLPDKFRTDGSNWGAIFADTFGVDVKKSNIFWSNDVNAIYSNMLYTRMPIWIHDGIKDCEEEYEQYRNGQQGTHINENPSMRPAWADYPALFPPSQYYRSREGDNEYSNPREVENIAKLKADLKYARRCGVLSMEGGYVVRVFNPQPSDRELQDLIGNVLDGMAGQLEGQRLEDALISQVYEECWKEIWASYDASVSEHPIVMLNGANQVADDELAEILRKQMKLYQIFQDSMEFFKGKIGSLIKERLAEWRWMY